MKYCFGVDVGGTAVKMGLFSTEGELIEKLEIPTRTENGGEAILPDVAQSICKLMEKRSINKQDVIGVGVGIPAPVDDEGIVTSTANLGWGYKDVVGELNTLLGGMKIAAANDANLAAMGEMWIGAGKGERNVVMVTLGTGVGGGIIVNGKMVIGENGAGGELGHICMEPDEKEVCGCGLHGCLEMYASATGVVRLARRRLALDDKDSVLRNVEELTAKVLWDAVREKDSLAEEIASQFGDYLGRALAMLAGVVDPSVILIGGGMAKAGEILVHYVEEVFYKRAFWAHKNTKILLATLGNDAGICGAARMILDCK